jgi:hypothetical protein
MGSFTKETLCSSTFTVGSPQARWRNQEGPRDHGRRPLKYPSAGAATCLSVLLHGSWTIVLFCHGLWTNVAFWGSGPTISPKNDDIHSKTHRFHILIPLGFRLIAALPPVIKFTAAYFGNDIILKIIDGMPFNLANSLGQLTLHTDNATPHWARESITHLKTSRIFPIDHPLYSPNLEPFDLYLFGKLKDALTRREFGFSKELLWVIRIDWLDRAGRAWIDLWHLGAEIERMHPDERWIHYLRQIWKSWRQSILSSPDWDVKD